jgi:hypothetical protein
MAPGIYRHCDASVPTTLRGFAATLTSGVRAARSEFPATPNRDRRA